VSYENPWIFDEVIFDSEDIDKYVGFVYCIVNLIDGRKYIGRKYFHSIRKVKGKSRRQKKESDWKNYYGSSKELLTDIEKHGIINFKRIILSLHTTRGDINYEEVKQQFLNNVLESDKYYNDNINGKWMRKPQHIVEGRKISSVRLEEI
jgi:hypothetical protein